MREKPNRMRWIWATAMLFAVGLFWNSAVLASPARPDIQTFRQPSGETFEGRLQGDENFHWAVTKSDEAIVQDAKGYWNYAETDSRSLKPSGKKVKIDKRPSAPKMKQDVEKWVQEHPQARVPLADTERSPSFGAEAAASSSGGLFFGIDGQRATGSQKVLVLLVSFTDVAIQYSDSQWNETFFGTANRSVKDYYREVSQGRTSLEPAEETSGAANDGIVKVSLNHSYVSGGQTVIEALNAADPYLDMSSFDTNGDGYIQNDELRVVTILAGFEQSYDGGAQTPTVWAHYTSLADSEAPVLDGKKACVGNHGAGYTQQGERHGNHQATIGVFAHELGHSFGLPDLYDTDSSSDGIGNHSLMSYGSWGSLTGENSGTTPVHMDAWSKLKLGFADAIEARNNASTPYALKSAGTGEYGVVKIPSLNDNQYFLIENRQLEGYDRSLNTHGGIAIWHIDESMGSNNVDTRRLVDLEKASSANPYYYSGNQTEFSPTTTPNSDIYTSMDGTSSKYTGIRVTVPQASSDIMTANIYGDYEGPAAPTGLRALYVAMSNAGLTWNASADPQFEGYALYRDGILVSRLTDRIVKEWFPGDGASSYTYTVRALDVAGNESPDSHPIIVEPAAEEKVIIYYKRGFATPYVHYKVHLNDPDEPWLDLPMVPSEYEGYSKVEIPTGTERISVTAQFHDGNGNWDNNDGRNYAFYSGVNTFDAGKTTENFPGPPPAAPDTEAPSAPTNVNATLNSYFSSIVAWTASTDNVAVTSYEVYRDGAKVGSTETTSFVDTGLAPSTTYEYTVKAMDAAGNQSAFSAAASVTTAAGNKVTIYYKQGFATPYIHYRPAGGTWTTSPGVAMPASEIAGYHKIEINIGTSSQLEACFNDGNGTWDSNDANNYLFGVGTWTYKPTGTIEAGAPDADDQIATIYYKNDSFASKYIHYMLDGSQEWTTAPGVQMSSSAHSGYSVATIQLGSATGLTAAFNNGGGTWDNNGGNNYHFGSGASTLANGNLYAGEPQADSVTFRVTVPSSTPTGGPVYLTGSFNGWNAADSAYQLTKGSDGVYSITVDWPAGTAVQYKFTRGSWTTVEATSGGADISNRTLTPSGGPQTVTLTVDRWKDS